MKQILLMTVVFLASITIACAQQNERLFKKVKGSVSLGYAFFPGNADIKNGFIFSAEPKYGVLDNVYVGARTELTFLAAETRNIEGYKDGDIKLKVYGSFLATGDFYFTSDYRFRPFAGIGVGPFLVASSNTAYENGYDGDEDGSNAKVKFGGMGRVGVEIKHFRISFEYNFVPKSTDSYTYYDSSIYDYVTTNTEFKNAYLVLKQVLLLAVVPGAGKKAGANNKRAIHYFNNFQ